MVVTLRAIALSVIGGFAVAMFAGGAMLFSRVPDESNDVDMWRLADTLVTAATGAGIPVSATILAGLLTIALVRSTILAVRTHRQAIRDLARSMRELVKRIGAIASMPLLALVRLLRTPRATRIELALLKTAIWVTFVTVAASLCALLASIGVALVGISTRLLMSSLDDPTVGPRLVLEMTVAAVGMYVGLAALATSVGLLYLLARPRRGMARLTVT